MARKSIAEQMQAFHPSAAAISPAHSKGKVMSSGSSVVSQSMTAKASSVAEKPHHARPVMVNPQRQAQKKKSAPVTASTSG